MSFPKYSNYREIGIEWIGSVPDHWDILPIKRYFRLLTDKTDSRSFPVALENIESWTGRYLPTESEFEGEGVVFQEGDILFGKLRPYLAKAMVAPRSGEAIGDFLVMRPGDRVVGRFAAYQMLTREFISIVDGATFGTKMPRASWEFVGGMVLPLPPKDEQVSIVAFLDRETAKIDALVAEQQRLIELLEEKRKVIVSNAVTKGLDPSVPLKESGVEWLGEVPRHWHVKRLKYSITNCRNGIWGADFRGDENDIPCIRVADFDRLLMRVHLENPTIRNVLPSERHQRLITKGNLLLEKSGGGDLQPVGFVVLYDDTVSAVCSNFIARVELAHGMHPGYWRYVHSTLYSARVNTRSINQTSGIQNLDQDRYFNELAPFPPPDEQKKIEEFIDLQTRKLDTLIVQANRVITLLRERRSTLISAVVTGQIDVRQLEIA